MYLLKAFMSMPTLVDNRLDQTAPFGELTTLSKTFTRDLRQYAKTTYPDVEMNVFHCVDEMGVRIEPSTVFMNQILALGQWVYTQHITKSIPTDANKPAFVNAIENEFPDITGVVIGEILTGQPDYNMPDYIQFKLLDGTRQYQGMVWFSDTAFSVQYDETIIFIIPPLPDINALIDAKPAVNQKLLEQLLSTQINRIQEIRGEHPETGILPLDLRWHDPNDTNAMLTTTWTAVIYGNAGMDSEAIKDAIREYIANNSDYDKWNEIYPDLYSENEFAIIPAWNELALQANALQVGLYSSLVPVNTIRTIARTFAPSGYSQSTNIDTYLNENLEVGSAVYRSLMFAAMGNPNNLNEMYKLRMLYPDYMAIDSADSDFARMSQATQEFCTKFTDALDNAYRYKPTDVLPAGYMRLIRRSYHYLAFEHNGYIHAILTKFTFDKYNTL